MDTARKAGYKGSVSVLNDVARTNLQKPAIQRIIKERESKANGKHIASREERQQFWTNLMRKAKRDGDKLKASELLGRSQADFVEVHEHIIKEMVEMD